MSGLIVYMDFGRSKVRETRWLACRLAMIFARRRYEQEQVATGKQLSGLRLGFVLRMAIALHGTR
jgi:hypothetical protein